MKKRKISSKPRLSFEEKEKERASKQQNLEQELTHLYFSARNNLEKSNFKEAQEIYQKAQEILTKTKTPIKEDLEYKFRKAYNILKKDIKEYKPELKIVNYIIASFILGSLLFFSFKITGNAIGNLNSTLEKGILVFLIALGGIAGTFFLRKIIKK